MGHELSGPNSCRKIARITQRDRGLPPSFIDVFDLLRRLARLASLVKLKFQRL